MNSVILIGTAATEPDMRYTQTGKAVTNFRISVPSGRKGKNGGDLSDFFTVVVWGDLAESVASNLRKGDRAFVQGRLQNESWTGDDGKKRWITKVTASSVDMFSTSEAPQTRQEERHEEGSGDAGPRDIDPDEIPF